MFNINCQDFNSYEWPLLESLNNILKFIFYKGFCNISFLSIIIWFVVICVWIFLIKTFIGWFK